MTRYYRVKVVLAVLTAAACISMASTSLPMCTEGEEDNCATCYDVLASQAVTSAKNRYNLQQAFFPPRRENPVLLEVIYKFDVNTTNGPIDESLNSSEVWFWTDSGFYLYQPLDVIQLTSLFFADYSLRRSKVILHLRQDCRGASEKHMELFTQRLELFAKRQTIHAKIDDNYIPKAVSVGILKDSHENGPTIHVSRLAFASQFVIPIVSFFLFLGCWMYYWESSRSSPSLRNMLTMGSGEDKKEWIGTKRDSVEVTILSAVIGSATFCLYVIALDITAMYNALNTVDASVMEYYTPDTGITNFSLEFGIVFLMFVEDLCVVFVMVVFCCIIACCEKWQDASCNPWSVLVYLTLGPVMCVVIHAYHIMIGFIHAPHHAGSVLIFYGIVTLVFVYFYQAFHSAFKIMVNCCIDKCCSDKNMFSKQKHLFFSYFFLFLFAIISIITSGLLVFIVAFFVLVPIDNAIDDAPSELFGIEQTVILLLAITVTYKVYSRKSDTLLSFIVRAKDKADEVANHGGTDDSNKAWDKLEEEEKYVNIGSKFLAKLQ